MKNIERYLNRPKTYSKFLKPQSYKSIFTQNVNFKPFYTLEIVGARRSENNLEGVGLWGGLCGYGLTLYYVRHDMITMSREPNCSFTMSELSFKRADTRLGWSHIIAGDGKAIPLYINDFIIALGSSIKTSGRRLHKADTGQCTSSQKYGPACRRE